MHLSLWIWVTLGAFLASPAVAGTIVINNGLAPPNPANVIDASNSYPNDVVFIQNVGCDATVQDPCISPGAPTTVEMVTGGQIGDPVNTPSGAGALDVYESSTFVMSDGFVRFNIAAFDSASITLTGGHVEEDILLFDSASAFMSGGSIDNLFVRVSATAVVRGGTLRIGPVDAGILSVAEFATLTVLGSGFAVDGIPVPYGPLVATSGTLSGVLASGDLINNPFFRGDATAQIVLAIPEPSLVMLLVAVGFGAGFRRSQTQRTNSSASTPAVIGGTSPKDQDPG